MESSKETPPSTTETNTSSGSYPLPSKDTLAQVAKLAIVEDRPVLFDYWTGSCDGDVIIGVRASGEKLLVKSSDEYTSPISAIYQVEEEYIVVTENSIYIVQQKIAKKRISE